MKNILSQSDSTNLLTFAILLASVKHASLTEYVLKVILGTIIWIGFKVASEHLMKKDL